MSSERARAAARASRELADTLTVLPPAELAAAVVVQAASLVATLLRADWERLLAVLHRDGGPRPGSLPAGSAWVCSSALHHLGHLHRAREVAALADTGSATEADRARLAAAETATAFAHGDGERAHERVRTALELARASGDDAATAVAWVAAALVAAMDGDRDENLRCYLRALDLAETAGDELTQERVLNNLASRAVEEGDCTEAIRLVHQALAINDRTGHLSSTAVLRHNLAEALFGLGRLDESLVEAEAARALWEAVEAPSVGASWQLLGAIQAARGNASQAAIAYAAAVAVAEEEGDSQVLAAALGGLAAVRVADAPDEADALVARLRDVPAVMAEAHALAAAGWVHLHAGRTDRARALAREAGDVARRHRDLPRVADALELAVLTDHADLSRPAHLAHHAEDPVHPDRPDRSDRTRTPGPDGRVHEAGRIWADTGNTWRAAVHELVAAHVSRDRLAEQLAREELAGLGVHADAWRIAGPLAAVAAPRHADVEVHTLGRFVVHRGAQPVPASAWPSRKARDVLKVLAARGDAGISRERLGHLLWPDATGVGNRLSVALSHLRSVLDPERAHPADHLVVADRHTLRLDLDHVAVDVVVFRNAARSALDAAAGGHPRAVRLLQAAAAMHTGEFCEDDGPEEWVLEPREEVEALGRDVVAGVAAALAEGPDPAEAVPWLARLVALDPWDEPTWRRLVVVLRGLGRYGEARRHHRSYALRMAELGVPAEPWSSMVGPPAPAHEVVRD